MIAVIPVYRWVAVWSGETAHLYAQSRTFEISLCERARLDRNPPFLEGDALAGGRFCRVCFRRLYDRGLRVAGGARC